MSEDPTRQIWRDCSEHLEQLLLDEVPEVSFLVDGRNLTILGVRGPVESLFGKAPDAWLESSILTLAPKQRDGRRIASFGPAVLGEMGFYSEIAVRTSLEEIRTMAVRVHPFEDSAGRALVLLRFLDMTEQARMQNEIQHKHEALVDAYAQLSESQKQLEGARRAASLSLFAAGLAHEINNPLGFALSSAGFLEGFVREHFRSNPEELQEAIEAIQEIHSGCSRISQIIKLLLELEFKVTPTTFDVVTLLRRLTKDVINARLNGPQNVTVHSDPIALSRLLQKLLDNALHAAGPKGQVSLSCSEDTNDIQIELHDSGPGIPPEILDRVFDPFFTTRPPGKGLGLGLFVAQRLAVALGGTIRLQNNPHEGGLAIVRIPRELPIDTGATPVSYESFRTGSGLPRRERAPD